MARRVMQRAVLVASLVCLVGPALAQEAGQQAPPLPVTSPQERRASRPTDALAMIDGSATAWSVSDTGAGCYLMSPYRSATSRVAIGLHPTFGLGLFALNVPISVAGGTAAEPVTIQLDDRTMDKPGHVMSTGLLFVPLDPPEVAAALRTLQATGSLWFQIRTAWITHAGQGLPDALAAYGRICSSRPAANGTGPGATAAG
jgi:hypothetical protein